MTEQRYDHTQEPRWNPVHETWEGPPPPAPQHRKVEEPKKPWYKRPITWVIAVLFVLVAACAGVGMAVSDSINRDYATPSSSTPSVVGPKLSVSQKNAIFTAKAYIQSQGFSRDGLIHQLVSFDEYTTADATTAVGSLHINYNDQAVRKAREYLDFQGFSRDGLVNQLVRFDKFTKAQATYAAKKVGL